MRTKSQVQMASLRVNSARQCTAAMVAIGRRHSACAAIGCISRTGCHCFYRVTGAGKQDCNVHSLPRGPAPTEPERSPYELQREVRSNLLLITRSGTMQRVEPGLCFSGLCAMAQTRSGQVRCCTISSLRRRSRAPDRRYVTTRSLLAEGRDHY